MSLRILHFSDLHLVKDEPSMKTLLMHFIQSMDEIQKDGNIDLVVFTGDLVDKGGCSFGNIDAAFKEFEKVVITPIIEKLKLPKERFVFIPGNHDTENDAKKNIEKTGIIKTYSLNEKQQIIDLKNSTDKSIIEMLCSRTNVFKEFEKTYYSENLNGGYQYGDFESNFKFDINGCKVGVTSLNAVWLCGLGDDKELFLGIDQITNSQPFLSDCDIKIILAAGIPGFLAAVFLAPKINVISLGDDMATGLGIHPQRVRFITILLMIPLCAAAVVVGKTIGFVGLMIPQTIRLFAGTDYRRVIPLSFLCGAVLLTYADIAARMIYQPYEVPIGIFTAMLGVPFFLYMAGKERG